MRGDPQPQKYKVFIGVKKILVLALPADLNPSSVGSFWSHCKPKGSARVEEYSTWLSEEEYSSAQIASRSLSCLSGTLHLSRCYLVI